MFHHFLRIFQIAMIAMAFLFSQQLDAQDCSDITVIFCGMPERVEQFSMEDYAEILRMRETGEIGSNISFAGLLKFGEGTCGISWQKELEPYAYDGTQYIDLGTKSGHEILPIKDDTLHATVTYLQEFGARKYADKYYQFFNSDSLGNLISRVATAHPAKNYVLILQGHGNGQYCMRDDYFPNRRGITAEELEKAIKKSGIKLHTILFHNCLMGSLENLAIYQHCARYAFISPNETCGGYLPHFLANLSKAGNNPDKLIELSRETIDFYAKTADRDNEIDTSLGYYDLSKMKRLLKTVKAISSWYNKALVSDSALINAAVRSTITADHDSVTQNANEKQNIEVNSKLILSHFIHQTIRLSKAPNTSSNIQSLESLYKKYLSQLKDMAYIKCNRTKDNTSNYNYLFASPSVSVFSMDKGIQSHYKNYEFDRFTHWSRFLMHLKVNPSYKNPYRTIISNWD